MNLNFISLDTANNKREALMLINKTICPRSDINMSLHRMVSGILDSLNFEYLNQSLYSNNS